MRRTIAGLLAAVTLGGLTVAVASPASAEDRRPCVSVGEFYDTPFSTTQRRLEARWEVAHKGIPGAKSNGIDIDVYIPSVPGASGMAHARNPHLEAFTYRACGYSINETWVVVYYRKTTHQLQVMVRLSEPDPTLHGHD
jgi:hypothetical protein